MPSSNPGLMRVALQMALLLIASIVAGAMTFYLHPVAPELYLAAEPAEEGEVNMARIAELEKTSGVLWVDARSRQRFDEEHIPGALLLNEQEFETLAFEYVQSGVFEQNTKPIVVYCDAQKCAASKKVAQRIEEMAMAMDNEVLILRGGWNAWKSVQK